MYLRRKIDQYLLDWKNDVDRKPLVVKGPRQVGKTKSILHFAKSNYENVIYINFIEEPKYKTITEIGYNPQDIIRNISKLDPNKKFDEFKTLIVFDEIQDFIDISTALKFFKLDGRFDIICSGSLLGINYNRIDSVSTGYKSDYELLSLDFEEFLWAKGYDASIKPEMMNHMSNITPFSELEYNLYRNLYMDFVLLGGMPEIVASYIEKGTFEGSLKKQIQIISDYKEDIRKYADGLDKSRILNIFNHIPIQLAKDNKKFQITKVDKNARFRDYRGTIEWLHEAGIVNICYALNSLSLPLKGNYDELKYKVYFKDTGLLVSLLDNESQEDLRANKNMGVYKGALYENLVSEALIKSGLDLYYYKNDSSTLELDFLVRSKNDIVPIEVKSENGRSTSLNTVIENLKYNNEIKYGIKLANRNIGFNGKIYTFPYFLSFLIKDFLINRSN